MNQAITDLWYGNIAPFEHCGSHDPDANALLRLMERNRKALDDGLTQAQKETFQKYIDCSEEFQMRMLELAFSEGFCLGGRILAEILA